MLGLFRIDLRCPGESRVPLLSSLGSSHFLNLLVDTTCCVLAPSVRKHSRPPWSFKLDHSHCKASSITIRNGFYTASRNCFNLYNRWWWDSWIGICKAPLSLRSQRRDTDNIRQLHSELHNGKSSFWNNLHKIARSAQQYLSNPMHPRLSSRDGA